MVPDDWRLQGQERYLHGVRLERRRYRPADASNDHDHCEFCFVKLMERPAPDVSTEGYTTADGDRWVCPTCFEDFKTRFEWR